MGFAPLAFNLPLFAGGAILKVRFEGKRLDGETNITLEPRDARAATLTKALSAAYPEEVDPILDWSGAISDLWMEGWKEDPWAAVAGLLLLARVGRAGDYESVIRRLAARHVWLADSEICLAYALAAKGRDGRRVLNSLKGARRRGYPFFALSSTLAYDLVSVLAASSEEEVRADAEVERGHWEKWVRRRVPAGWLFCLWQSRAEYRETTKSSTGSQVSQPRQT